MYSNNINSKCLFLIILVAFLTSVFGVQGKEIHVNVDEYHTCIPLEFRPPHTLTVPSRRIRIFGETLAATRYHIIPFRTLRSFINLVLSRNPFESGLGAYLARNVREIYSYFEENAAAGAFRTARLPPNPTVLFLYSDRPNFGRSRSPSFSVDHRMLAAFAWIPANLFYGPDCNRRAHDPGDNFETDAARIVGHRTLRVLRRIYDNMQNYINNPRGQTAANYDRIMADLTTVASARNRPYEFNPDDWVEAGVNERGQRLYDLRTPRIVEAEEVTTPPYIHDELRKRSLLDGVTDDDYLRATESVCEEYLKHMKPKFSTNYTQIDIDDDVVPLFVYSINNSYFVYGQNEKTRSWFIKRVDQYGRVGEVTDHGTWQNYYAVQFHFEINGNNYFFGHDLKTRYWFIQLLDADGKMGRETHNGFLAFSYKTLLHTIYNGKHYLYGQAESDRRFFMRQLNSDGTMGPEDFHGTWPYYYDIQIPITVKNEPYLFTYNTKSNVQFNITGAPYFVSDRLFSTAFPISLAGQTYFFLHDPVSKHLLIAQVGNIVENKDIDFGFTDARPFIINGYQYFYAKLRDSTHWYLFHFDFNYLED